MPEHELPSDVGVPSEKDLEELQKHIDMLKKEKEKRQRKLSMAKKELTTIWETTEIAPEAPFEKDIISQNENFSLSNETFKTLEEIISKAKKKKSEMENEKNALVKKLKSLWQRLKVDERKRIDFLSNHVDYRLSIIKSIREEIERCEKIKKDNIKMFISSLRQELQRLWDTCYVSESARQNFERFTCSEATDDGILEAFEVEVDKWEIYYEEVQHIVEKIEKRKELWELMIEFEQKASDPNRFKNRKGNLLLEEKERKKYQKDLPALENSIFQEIELYERQKGLPFLYFGEDFGQFVANQWSESTAQKENGKQERQKLHVVQLSAVTGTPGKRPHITLPKSTPSKILKSSNDMSLSLTPVAPISRMMPSTTGKALSKVTRLSLDLSSKCHSDEREKLITARKKQ